MICAALLTGGCSDTAPAGGPSADEEPRVEVGFRLEAPDTDTSLEPMTRASSYKEWFGNACRLLILKRPEHAGSWMRRKPFCWMPIRVRGPN